MDETETPFVSCYLNLEQGEDSYRKALEDRALAMRSTLEGDAKADFDAAIGPITNYLSGMLRPGAKGVALFSRHYRGGAFFLPMQVAAPLPNWSEWTKAHYESHRRELTSRFLKEQTDLLESLIVAGGHTHLILAGDPRLTGEIRRAMPKSVAAKPVDSIPVASRDKQDDVVAATLSAFIECEEQESQAVAARFVQGIRTQGRAAAGAAGCLAALREQRADMLLLARDLLPEPGWRCAACGVIRIAHPAPAACTECGKKSVQPVDATVELVRLAGQQDCPIEVVDHCDPLMAPGGIGCLLRR